MRWVEGPSGNRYYLLKRSSSSSLLFDPETGEQLYRPTEELQHLGEPMDERRALLELVEADGPVRVRTLLDGLALCESDLHGMLLELQAAGLIEERTVHGERGYAMTGAGREQLDQS